MLQRQFCKQHDYGRHYPGQELLLVTIITAHVHLTALEVVYIVKDRFERFAICGSVVLTARHRSDLAQAVFVETRLLKRESAGRVGWITARHRHHSVCSYSDRIDLHADYARYLGSSLRLDCSDIIVS